MIHLDNGKQQEDYPLSYDNLHRLRDFSCGQKGGRTLRRMENDLLFFHELIGNCSVEKDSKIYTISPKFGKGTMQSFEVMPGAEIVYSNVHITTPIQKNIQCKDRFIEVTYCFHGRVNMLFSNQPEMVMSDHYISVFNGASHLKSCDFGKNLLLVFQWWLICRRL